MAGRFARSLPVLIALVLLPAARAEDWPVPRGPSHEPVPYRYDPQLIAKLPRAFLEDAPCCMIYSGLTHLVEADGTVESISHEIIRFNGRKGIEKLGEYRSISYDPAYQKVTLNTARVLKADGRTVAIEPRHLQLRDLSTDYQVYDHDKQLVISFPNLEVGDAIEVKWSVRGKNPEYQGQFFTRYSFGDDKYPSVLDEVRVRVPRGRMLKYAAVNGKLDPAVREEAAGRLYHWHVANWPGLPQDENVPSKEELRLQVTVSTFGSWEEVFRWKQKLRADCWRCTEDIRKTVREVTAGLTTPTDKARALTYWVRRHVRYVSVGPVTHDYKPHTPAEVIANRYGDCKDQSQLLAVMLREAGLDVCLVTLGARDDGQILDAVPSPWGSHAILLVTIDGKEHWIDPTISLAPWDYLPRDDRDRVVYVTNDRGIRVTRTPALTAESNRIEQTTLVSVLPGGTARCQRKVVYHGAAAVSQREEWTEVPPGERRRLVASSLQDSNSRSRLRRLQVNEQRLRDLDRPVDAALEFEIPGHFSGSPELEGGFTDSRVWGRLLAYTIDYDRQVPLDLGSPVESIHRYVIRLPYALKFESQPRDVLVRSRWGFFRLAVLANRKDDRLFALEFRLRLNRTRVEVAELPRFRKFQSEVSKYWRAWFTLKPTNDPADAPFLEALVLLAPQDATSAVTLGRLYCNHGKFVKARRVLDWARFLHPDNKELWELTVRAAATPADEEAAYREMRTRFPKDGKYAVALGALRVKRGDAAGAKAVLEPITRTGPADLRAAAHYQLAQSALRQHQPAVALEQFEAAARADPATTAGAEALAYKARVYEKLGRPKDAAGAYRLALKADGESAPVLNALVRLELAAGRRPEALDYLRRYTVVVGEDLQGMVRAADFHLLLGRHDDALDLATRALAIRHDTAAQRILGLVYHQRGDEDKALGALEQAEKTAVVREALIRGNIARGRLADALRHREQSRELKEPPAGLREAWALADRLKQRRADLLAELNAPADKAVAAGRAVDALVCAELARSQGRPPQVVAQLLAPAFGGGVDVGPAYSLRAQLALEQGRLRQALADADQALTLTDADARASFVRGKVLLERGAPGAVSDLARAGELSFHEDPEILAALAAALFQERRCQDALAAQREALKLRPRDMELQAQLREMERAEN